jgi:hypothetical protein
MATISSVLYTRSIREERERQLLVFFLSFFILFYLHTHTTVVFNSMREQEQLHFLSCSIFADKLFSDQLSRRASIECDSD